MNKKTIILLSSIGTLFLAGLIVLILGIINISSNNNNPNSTINSTVTNRTEDVYTPVFLEKPTISIESSNVSYDSFNYLIKLKDENSCGKINSYKIYNKYNSTKILKTEKDLTEPTEIISNINQLTANTTYVIEVDYQYDIQDGKGLVKEIFYKEITTLKYAVPTLSFETKELSYNETTISITIFDESTTLTIDDVYLKLNDQTIDDISIVNFENEYKITNLRGNNNYKVFFEYSYNLNDGAGRVIKKSKFEFSTPLKEYIPMEDSSEDSNISPESIILPNAGFEKLSYSVSVVKDTLFINESYESDKTVFIIYYDSNVASTKNLLKYSAAFALKNTNVRVYYVDLNEVLKDSALSEYSLEEKKAMIERFYSKSELYLNGQKIIEGLKINASTTYQEFVEHIESYIYQE